jgi:ABC-type lipoprotein export system ATPase subunit
MEVQGVSCSRTQGAGPLAPVNGVSLEIREKSLNLLSGDGHSGKGLLLLLLGLLEAPDRGEILFRGEGTRTLGEDARAALRSQRFGFVFAQPYLLPSFSVVENVAMPLFKISGVGADEAQRRTEAMLDFTGMGAFAEALVEQLTYAQQYRVSLARALVNEPEVLIMENLDAGMPPGLLSEFIGILRRAGEEFGTAAIFTTKEKDVPGFEGRVIELADGAVSRDSQPSLKEGGATV